MNSSFGSPVRDVVVGGAQVVGTLVGAPILRSRYNVWGATPAEVASPMPGDDLVADPRLGYTRAITISAAPTDVWAWLVQIGQGRGGLYSFDGLENLARCDIHSADRIHPELQSLARGRDPPRCPPGVPLLPGLERRPWRLTGPDLRRSDATA